MLKSPGSRSPSSESGTPPATNCGFYSAVSESWPTPNIRSLTTTARTLWQAGTELRLAEVVDVLQALGAERILIDTETSPHGRDVGRYGSSIVHGPKEPLG